MLQKVFESLLLLYTDNTNLIKELWFEVEKNYSGRKRHYHNLHHLENLHHQLLQAKAGIKDWNTILFTLFYHDIIYNPVKSDNEEKSADLAEKRMRQLSVPVAMIELCRKQILATKSHIISPESDTNYFTDADLSILGQAWEDYRNYYKNVRKEYAVYPDLLYNPGRKKVLQHFLGMERIFKTEFFYEKFELQAKLNLQDEYNAL